MKSPFAKKTTRAALSLLFALSLALALFSCQNNVSSVDSTGTGGSIGIGGYFFPNATAVRATKQSYVYGNNGQAWETVQTIYLDGWEDVPFLSVVDVGKILSVINGRGYNVSPSSQKGVYTYSYYSPTTPTWPAEWNNDTMYFDANAQTVWSDEFVRIICRQACVNNGFGGDSVGYNATASDVCPKIEFSAATDQPKAKERTVVRLGDYGLKMFEIGGVLYVPFQALSVVFLQTSTCVFNGTDYYVYLDTSNDGTASHKAFESGRLARATRSRLMAEYNYRVLCLTFDANYCLKKQRSQIGKDDINLINDSIFAAGFGFGLLSTDTAVYDTALVRFLVGYIDDGHTGYMEPSMYQSMSAVPYYANLKNTFSGPRRNALKSVYANCEALRKKYGGDANDWWYILDGGSDPEMIVIAFDTFLTSNDFVPYKFLADTFEKIGTDYPGVKNIVIDLSCNGGGAINQCLAALSFLGDDIVMPQKNHLDNSVTRFRYNVTDANGNSLKKNYNFYVLTSGCSFSCGNYFPAVCKYQLHIPIIGQQSGGGGGVVKETQTADGAVYQTSAACEMCAVDASGNYISIDHGVPVDLEIPYEDFYSDGVGGESVTYWNLYKRIRAAYPSNF